MIVQALDFCVVERRLSHTEEYYKIMNLLSRIFA